MDGTGYRRPQTRSHSDWRANSFGRGLLDALASDGLIGAPCPRRGHEDLNRGERRHFSDPRVVSSWTPLVELK